MQNSVRIICKLYANDTSEYYISDLTVKKVTKLIYKNWMFLINNLLQTSILSIVLDQYEVYAGIFYWIISLFETFIKSW